ncbi:MAG: response regulator [Maribacter sp.]|nr:response regulator [Maribacter sp.]
MTKINSIFVIDDDSIMVFGIKKILSSVVICDTINAFGNGQLALDAILDLLKNNEEVPDIIFLDINMPIMDGWQFLEEFIALPIQKKVRINIVTSSIDTYDRENWEKYKLKTHHTLTYNNKPIGREIMAEVTKAA